MKPIAFGKRAGSRALIASVLIAWMSATHARASPRVWQPVILKGAALSELQAFLASRRKLQDCGDLPVQVDP